MRTAVSIFRNVDNHHSAKQLRKHKIVIYADDNFYSICLCKSHAGNALVTKLISVLGTTVSSGARLVVPISVLVTKGSWKQACLNTLSQITI